MLSAISMFIHLREYVVYSKDKKGVYCNDALFQRQNLKRKKDIYNDKRLVF